MVTELFRRQPKHQLEETERDFAELIVLTSQQIRSAVEVVIGRHQAIGAESAFLDRQLVNRRMVEGIRRRLIVHAAVRGHEVDFPLLLVWMSTTKDVDRIGQLAGDLWQLSSVEATLEPDAIAELMAAGETAGNFMTEIPELITGRNSPTAERLLHQIHQELAAHQHRMLTPAQDETPEAALTMALSRRYIESILVHVANLMSSVVVPVDRLDHWPDLDTERRLAHWQEP